MQRFLVLASVLAMSVAVQAQGNLKAACRVGCGPAPSPPPSSSPAPSVDPGAERGREEIERLQKMQAEEEKKKEQEAEDQKQRDAEKAKLRQEEFERNKQKALTDMKGIAGELGFKGDNSGDFGFKSGSSQATAHAAEEPECQWGDMGSNVVDLRCLGLDASKPIVVDPHIVRGQPRAFPAQIDPATFKNANYSKGFEALMRPTFNIKDATDAVAYFQAAQLQRPNDPLVRNGLLLARDILRARKDEAEKTRKQEAEFAYLTLQSYASLMMGENRNAGSYIAQARKLNPNDNTAKFVESLARLDLGSEATWPRKKDAYRLVANSLVSIRQQDTAGAARMLEAAQRLLPYDKTINGLLQGMHDYQAATNKVPPTGVKP